MSKLALRMLGRSLSSAVVFGVGASLGSWLVDTVRKRCDKKPE